MPDEIDDPETVDDPDDWRSICDDESREDREE